MLRHSTATGVATRKIGSKQRQRPIQKHAGRSSIDRKTAPHLSDSRYLMKCDPLSCEGVVKTVQTIPRRNKELCPARDCSPSMLLYGGLSLFRTDFRRCNALLCFVTSSLASPIIACCQHFNSNICRITVKNILHFFFSSFTAILKEAVRTGKTATVERALRSGFDVELTDGIQGVTLLMTAAMAGQDATLLQLLQSGARVNIPQRNGATALMLAAEEVRVIFWAGLDCVCVCVLNLEKGSLAFV